MGCDGGEDVFFFVVIDLESAFVSFGGNHEQIFLSSPGREKVGSIGGRRVFTVHFQGTTTTITITVAVVILPPPLSFPDRTSLPRRESAVKSMAGTYLKLSSPLSSL
jgi:hypothetical protein